MASDQTGPTALRRHRTRGARSLLLPAVLVGGLAAVALPGAVAAPSSTSPAPQDASAPGSLIPVGWTTSGRANASAVSAQLADEDELPPKRTNLGVVLAVPTSGAPTPDAPAAPVDGAPAAPAPVDTAAVAAQAAQVLSGAAGALDGSTGIPATVLAAYKKAEANLAAAEPACHLPWWVLAGIGHTESDHAYGGRVDANGTTRGRILGILLDGSVPGTAVVHDTDGGKWDGDATYDRAVGPMQFLPGSWRTWGKDGNGDGVADPNNVFDAATAAGYLLCAAGDLSSPATLTRAILSYNNSASYVQTVLTWGTAYRDGATPSPDAAGSVPSTPATPVTTPPPPPAPAPAPAATSSAPAPRPSTSPTSAPSTTTSPTSRPSTTTSPTAHTTPPTTSSTSSTTKPPSPASSTSSTTCPTTSTTSSTTTSTTSSTTTSTTSSTTTSTTTSTTSGPTTCSAPTGG